MNGEEPVPVWDKKGKLRTTPVGLFASIHHFPDFDKWDEVQLAIWKNVLSSIATPDKEYDGFGYTGTPILVKDFINSDNISEFSTASHSILVSLTMTTSAVWGRVMAPFSSNWMMYWPGLRVRLYDSRITRC